MKIFLIVVAVLALIIIAVCSLSATVTLVYDKGWSTRVKVLFFEKDIVLSELLSRRKRRRRFLIKRKQKRQRKPRKSKR